ncbi:hypothetical protein AYI68_g396 [Smittium mucronatum]|uniref:Uncharacterized protein n=1 Tax=Smittium mucronatum TaxID=133383 RepID=A0A1R0H8A3_9FUNG|nr:hypothetical protein AYI68_g396 [Smittium mucronatum]
MGISSKISIQHGSTFAYSKSSGFSANKPLNFISTIFKSCLFLESNTGFSTSLNLNSESLSCPVFTEFIPILLDKYLVSNSNEV